MRLIRWLCVAFILSSIALNASAQNQQASAADYPWKPIRVVLPAPVGGTLDIVCRMVSQKLTEAWGQPVIVDNRAGAGGTVGVTFGARATPDGHTLVCMNSITIASLPALYRNLAFDNAGSRTPR
jgi:tripartite-type tricarboxylate transporter receptor subunit TctC